MGRASPEPTGADDGQHPLAAGRSVPLPFDVPTEALGALAEVGGVMPAAGATTAAPSFTVSATGDDDVVLDTLLVTLVQG